MVYQDASIRQARDNPPESLNLNTDKGRQTRSLILSSRSRWQYPLVESEVHLGKIRFAVHEANPIGVNTEKLLQTDTRDNVRENANSGGNVETVISDATAEDPDTLIDDASGELAATEQAAKFVSGVSYKLSRTLPIVDMYVPISITFNDTMMYDNPGLNMIGGGTLAAMANPDAGMLGVAYESVLRGLGDVFGFMKGDFAGETARLSALRGSRLLPFLRNNAGFQAAVSIGLQRAINPNTRSVFKGVNLREFTFTFKLIANSQREAIVIENIVKHFRSQAYPESIGSPNFPIGYKFPNAFSLQFTHRGKEAKIPKLERCFLRGVQTVYNSTGAAFHVDGRPNEIDLTLNFIEMRTLNKDDVFGGGY